MTRRWTGRLLASSIGLRLGLLRPADYAGIACVTLLLGGVFWLQAWRGKQSCTTRAIGVHRAMDASDRVLRAASEAGPETRGASYRERLAILADAHGLGFGGCGGVLEPLGRWDFGSFDTQIPFFQRLVEACPAPSGP